MLLKDYKITKINPKYKIFQTKVMSYQLNIRS